MAIVKGKEKKAPSNIYSFRADNGLSTRIDKTFNQVLTVQPEIKKAELIRDAIERGLTEIEQQLKTVVTSNDANLSKEKETYQK